MSLQVSVHEAETHFSKLLMRAREGQEIIITNAGRPVARLVPITERGIRRIQGSAKGKTIADFGSLLPENVLTEFES